MSEHGKGPAGGGPAGGGPMGGGKVAEKPKNFKGTIVKLFQYLKPYTISISMVFIFAIISTIFTIVSPKILGNATDTIANGFIAKTVYKEVQKNIPEGVTFPSGTKIIDIMKDMPEEIQSKMSEKQLEIIKNTDINEEPAIDFDAVLQIIIWLICLYLLSAFFSYMQGIIMAGVSQKITYNLRQNISVKMDKIPLGYFDTHSHGDILSRVSNDVDTVSTSLSQSMTQIVTSITTIIGILIMMFSISWVMTLVSLLVLPLSMILISIMVKFSQKYFVRQQQYLSDLNGHVEEMYSGHTIVKAFNGEERSIKEFNKISDSLCTTSWKSQFLSGMMMPIMSFIGNIGYVAVCVVGGFLAVKNVVTIGNIQSFIMYVRQFNQPISQVSSIVNVLQSTAAAAERVFEFLDENEESSENQNPIHLDNVIGKVEFKNVHFGYNPDKIIVNDFSCTIMPGQKVAIVGPTGAGKTTMVKLLMRFYDINSGKITIDGVDIKDMTRNQLRDMFGMVLQDTWLFNGSIMENIRYGRIDADDKAVYDATKAAHVDRFINTLPDGYNTEMNEEASNVSIGQKQLLTIARAVISEPKIMILDEATSSVDTRTEVLIQSAMQAIMKDRTSFIIAHRLSTIRDADLILVMKDGDIVEKGNHDELIDQKGFYYSLYNSQFEGKEI